MIRLMPVRDPEIATVIVDLQNAAYWIERAIGKLREQDAAKQAAKGK